jgi:hypothetical protein
MVRGAGCLPGSLFLCLCGWSRLAAYIDVIKLKVMIKIIKNLYGYLSCKYCGRDCGSTGSGMSINGMCERCYENGGDDE